MKNKVLSHYGYKDNAQTYGFWPINEETLERLRKLPDALDPKEKFRVTFDYDPEFGTALLQVDAKPSYETLVHKDPPRADKHDTDGLMQEYAAHIREERHHRECAHWVLMDILRNLIGAE